MEYDVMLRIQKLRTAQEIFAQELEDQILSRVYYAKLNRIRIILNDGTKIFVQYNNHEEYSYSIVFSAMEEDRARFDNYDDKWEVDSRPHHFPPRMSTSAAPSPMVGHPEEDIPELCHLIKTGDLLSPEFRF